MLTSPNAGTPLRVLLVEDSEDDMLLILRELKRSGFAVGSHRVETEETLTRALGEGPWDIVISDFNMPRLTGLRALELVRGANADLPFILVSGSVGEQLAVQAMKAGAQDYLMKDNLVRLSSAVERELQETRERGRRREAEAALAEKSKQLAQSQRLEAIGRLAGGIAHDLNNVIGACTLYAELALDPEQEPEAVRESIREIVKAQERSTRLVRQLLAFSRKQVMDPRVISVNGVIADLKKMLSQILGEDIDLVDELEPELLPVRADPAQLDQVIMNLVVNARDAMPKGGRLLLKTANETVRPGQPQPMPELELPPGDYVRLSVTDTGMGIDPKIMSRIFEPFFTTKEVGKGTGLGLATVFGIVKQAKGEIRVTSELGKGTTFEIFLGAAEGSYPEPQPSAVPPVPAPATGPRTLLLVEDEPSYRQVLAKSLSRMGYRVLTAGDGEEAIRLFDSHVGEIDLVVSDVVMPKISGPDMAGRLWDRRPALRVLFLSGYGYETLAAHKTEGKGAYFLPKPFTTEQFARKVAEILGG